MLRIFLWVIGVLGAIVGALAVFLFFAFQPDFERETYGLKGGAQIELATSVDGTFSGEAFTTFVLSLRHPDGSVEEVVKDKTWDFAPGPPFDLRSNGTSLFLRCDALFYKRPQSGGTWRRLGDLKGEDEMFAIAHLLMPDVYTKQNQHHSDPPIAKYVLERWDESKNIVVLIQSARSEIDKWPQTPEQNQRQSRIFQKWPRRLVFRDFQFDQQSTLDIDKSRPKN